MDIKQEIEMQRDMYARQLKQKAESLKMASERILLDLERNNFRGINELGEVQSLGCEVDVLCGKVNLLNRLCKEQSNI